tara:strand:- start:379 stop:630 length:252 start_codon:yes stop_codon:yes gene_type:complete
MGRASLQSMIEISDEERALRWHLTGNFFPPIHIDFIEPAQKAINLVREDKGEEIIEMPNGKSRTAWQIVEGLKLEEFLIIEEE